jgi:transcriptional regulator with XRE-family HTH domain
LTDRRKLPRLHCGGRFTIQGVGELVLHAEGRFKMTGFGQLLRELRKTAGLTQEQLAEVTGVTNSYISALEKSRKPAPPRALVVSLAENLNADATRMWRLARAERERRLRARVNGIPTSKRESALNVAAPCEGHSPLKDAHVEPALSELLVELTGLADTPQEHEQLIALLEVLLGWLRARS